MFPSVKILTTWRKDWKLNVKRILMILLFFKISILVGDMKNLRPNRLRQSNILPVKKRSLLKMFITQKFSAE